MLELITGVAKDKLHKRMGKRLNEVDDPEMVIKELYEIYDSQGNFRRARREFEDRDQKPNESLRDYLESLLALHREADQESSLPSENERVCRRFLKGLRDPELAHPAMQRLLLAEKHRASEKHRAYDEDYLQKILTQAEAQKQAARDEQKTQRRDSQAQQFRKPERMPLKTIAEESPQHQTEQAVNFSSYQAPDAQLYASAPTSRNANVDGQRGAQHESHPDQQHKCRVLSLRRGRPSHKKLSSKERRSCHKQAKDGRSPVLLTQPEGTNSACTRRILPHQDQEDSLTELLQLQGVRYPQDQHHKRYGHTEPQKRPTRIIISCCSFQPRCKR